MQSWSMTVSTELKPFNGGNLTIKSMATVLNGSTPGFANMGLSGAFLAWLFALFLLRHGRDVHPMWVKLFTETLSSRVLVLSTKSEEDLVSS